MFSSTLTTLTTDLCTIAFQLLAYQEEFFAKFSKNLNNTLTLIKNINFRSAIVKSRERQTKVTSNDNDLSAFFSSNWIIDKIILRRIIKQFLLNIKEYQQTLQKSNSHFQSSIFSFTDNKSIQLSLTFFKHVKNNFSSADDISIVWSIVFDIFQNFTKTMTSSEQFFNQSFNQFSRQNLISNLNITKSQMQTLSNVLIVAVDTKINRLEIELRQLLQSSAQSQTSTFTTETQLNDDRDDFRSNRNWTSKKIEFFDFTAEESRSVINLSKHVFYRNVYAFVNRLKNVSFIREKDKLRVVISQCLRSIVFIWHSTELFEIEKKIYRDMSLQNWCNVFIKRFKERVSVALNYLQSIKYTLKDAKKHRDFRTFVQNLFKHVKVANFISIYNQLILIWNNLNWQFRQHVFQLIEQITIQIFLKQLDNNCDIWFELTFANQILRIYTKRFFINKSFYQDVANKNRNFSQSSRSFFSKQENAYQNNTQNRIIRLSQVEITVKVDNMKKSEREFDKDDRNKTYDVKERYREKFKQKNRFTNDKNKKKFRAKTYLTQQDCDDENDSNDDIKKLNYFDSNYENFDDFENTILINHTISFEISCRRCHRIFSSNNQLHRHLRSRTCHDTFKKANAFFNAMITQKAKFSWSVSMSTRIKT